MTNALWAFTLGCLLGPSERDLPLWLGSECRLTHRLQLLLYPTHLKQQLQSSHLLERMAQEVGEEPLETLRTACGLFIACTADFY